MRHLNSYIANNSFKESNLNYNTLAHTMSHEIPVALYQRNTKANNQYMRSSRLYISLPAFKFHRHTHHHRCNYGVNLTEQRVINIVSIPPGGYQKPLGQVKELAVPYHNLGEAYSDSGG